MPFDFNNHLLGKIIIVKLLDYDTEPQGRSPEGGVNW